MRVCPHPVRSRIFRALRETGPLTASRLGEIIDAGTRALADFAADEVHYPREWREAATFVTDVVHVTPTEMSEISEQICDVLDPYHRDQDDRPTDALPVRFSIHAVPTQPPGQSSTRRNRRRS